MSRNFFSDILNVEGVLYQGFITLFNGSWGRLNRPKSGASAIVPPPPMRPGQRRPGMPPGMMPPQGAPQRPGMQPQRPGMPPQAQGMPPQAQGQPIRPGQPQQPGQPGIMGVNVPQIPGLTGPGSKVPTRSEEEFNLIKSRGKGALLNEFNRQLSQMYMRARSFFEMRS